MTVTDRLLLLTGATGFEPAALAVELLATLDGEADQSAERAWVEEITRRAEGRPGWNDQRFWSSWMARVGNRLTMRNRSIRFS